MTYKIDITMLALIAVTAPVTAQVDFSQRSIIEASSEAQLRAAAGTADTLHINGVAVQPGPEGDLFAIHVDSTNSESFLRVDADTGTATKLTDQATVINQLGSPYSGAITLVGGFAYSSAADALYFAENFTEVNFGDVSIIKLDANTGAASLTTRTTELEGLNDHSVLPNGDILVTLPEAGSIGTVGPGDGVYTELLTEADLLAQSPGSTALPPESIVANQVGGETFIFSHDDLDLFKVPDITSDPPTVIRLTQPELASVDLHDLAVDEAGNLYGYDAASNLITIVSAANDEVVSLPLTEIGTALGGGAFAPTFWRGLAARQVNATQSDLFLASSTSSYGIVQVRFGTAPASVNAWNLY